MKCALVFVLLLVGCAKEYRVPEDFQPYVQRFIDTASAEGRPIKVDDLIVEFTEKLPEEGSVGECQMGIGATPTIRIYRKAWITDEMFGSDGRHTAVMFHELGHCVLGREHKNDLQNGDPVSLMNGNILTAERYLLNEADLNRELFQ